MNGGRMQLQRVNYDEIATEYDRRYQVSPMKPVGAALRTVLGGLGAARVLEVGCGTGHWLAELAAPGREMFGLDASMGMLRAAQAKVASSAYLAHGQAEHLPFRAASFEFVYVVNALHHFTDRQRFIDEARRVLAPGGALAIIGMTPPRREDWYVYEYFDGTYEIDIARFASRETLRDWLTAAGFVRVESRIIHEINEERVGRAVLDDVFVEKRSTSQLALLSEEAYQIGIRRLRAAIARAEATGRPVTFRSRLQIVMLLAHVPMR